MTQKRIHRDQVHPIIRIILFLVLIICGALLLTSINWIFHKIHYGSGLELAEVAVALISILILVLMLIGICTGLGVDRFIRHQNAVTWRLYKSSRLVRSLLKSLGYEESRSDIVEVAKPGTSSLTQLATSLSNTTPRRGRPPLYSLERWAKVVLAWENRDPIRNPMTLAEFLSEQFGENADGSPLISENCFYANRKKVLDELQKEISARRP